MSHRTCKMYRDTAQLTEAGLAHAYQMTLETLKWERSHPRFQGPHSYADHVEAMAMLILESDYRWENGGKQRFDELIQRTFGRPSTQG